MWKAMTNCLATKANLAGRRVPCSSTCPICDYHPESVEHAPLTYPLVIGDLKSKFFAIRWTWIPKEANAVADAAAAIAIGGMGLVGSISSDQILVLYYHDSTHNIELESEDKGQQQHSEDVGNEDEYEEEEEEKEDVIVDSDYELSEEEENEMNKMPLNECTGEISDDDKDSDRLPFDGDSSGDEEEGQKKTSKKKWKKKKF
ncbi:unnamed protein product [Prunus brigantina]